jgi:Protein of unknown function (DUF3592)
VTQPPKPLGPAQNLGIGLVLTVLASVWFGGGAMAIRDELEWRDAVRERAVIVRKSATPGVVVYRYARALESEDYLPARNPQRAWQRAKAGDPLLVEYSKSDPRRHRLLSSTTEHVRGVSRFVVGGMIMAVFAVPLFFGLRFLGRGLRQLARRRQT